MTMSAVVGLSALPATVGELQTANRSINNQPTALGHHQAGRTISQTGGLELLLPSNRLPALTLPQA